MVVYKHTETIECVKEAYFLRKIKTSQVNNSIQNSPCHSANDKVFAKAYLCFLAFFWHLPLQNLGKYFSKN